jgi:hypothetical protein
MRAGVLRAILAAAVIPLAACSGSPTAPTSANARGTVNVMLKDTPFTDAGALFVTFSGVSVLSDGGWTTVPFSGGGNARTCDLKRLADVRDILVTGAIPAGHYTAVLFNVANAELFFDNGTSGAPCGASLDRPAGASAPVAVPIHQARLDVAFDVDADGFRNILVDFDAAHSVIRTDSGVYALTPVVTVVSVQ